MSSHQDTDQELMAIITKFALLIRSYVQQYRLLDFGVDPEDVYQEVRIRLWKTLFHDQIIHKPSSYIKKVVTTVVIDQLRKHRREEGVLFLEKMKCVSDIFPNFLSYQSSDNRDIQLVLEAALEKIILSRRSVIKLYLLNLSVPEIAAMYNWSLNKTRNLLYRGLMDLKNILRNGDSYDASP